MLTHTPLVPPMSPNTSGSKIVQQVMASYGDEYFKQVCVCMCMCVREGGLVCNLDGRPL
jgi:hypothetical protein